MAVERFYWVIGEVLAGCSRPGGDAGLPERVAADLQGLHDRGIRALLSLTETPLPADLLAARALASLHLPVPDLHPPTPEELLCAVEWIDTQRGLCRPVAVHCRMGQGRAATVLAAHQIRHGRSAVDALADLRRRCDHAIGSPSQEEALLAFAACRDWIV